jgi:hypothetical protein
MRHLYDKDRGHDGSSHPTPPLIVAPDEGHRGFIPRPPAPVQVPRSSNKMPTKRPVEEKNDDRQVKTLKPGLTPANKGMMDIVYLDASGGANGRAHNLIPLMAGNLLGRTFSPLPPGHIDIGIGRSLSGDGIPAGLVQVRIVHPPKSIDVELIPRDSEIVFYERHHIDGIKTITRIDERNCHAKLLAGDSLIFNHFHFQVRHSPHNAGLTYTKVLDRTWTPPVPINVVTPTVTPYKSLPTNSINLKPQKSKQGNGGHS